MTRAEYHISLAMWNQYIREKSPAELMILDRAWGSLGKALTHFQATVAMHRLVQKYFYGKKLVIESMQTHRFYTTIVREMDHDTKEVWRHVERQYREEEICFD